MMNKRTNIEVNINEAKNYLNASNPEKVIEIIEPTISIAQNQYYATGLNNDRDSLFLCYSLFAIAHEMLYNLNNQSTDLNLAIVYFNNAIRLKEELKKATNMELRQVYDLYSRIALLNRDSLQKDINDLILVNTKRAYKLYKKTKNIEDLMNYLNMLEYSADYHFYNRHYFRGISYYKKLIKLFKEANMVKHNEESRNEVYRIYKKVIKKLDNKKFIKLKDKLIYELKQIGGSYE